MEDHTCTDDTLKIFHAVKENIRMSGIVIQAYLRRSEVISAGLPLRKRRFGSVKESTTNRPRSHSKGKEKYSRITFVCSGYCSTPAAMLVSQHTTTLLLNGAKAMIAEMKLSPNEYEFQMLLGVRGEAQ